VADSHAGLEVPAVHRVLRECFARWSIVLDSAVLHRVRPRRQEQASRLTLGTRQDSKVYHLELGHAIVFSSKGCSL
jgi:hypothetical protein